MYGLKNQFILVKTIKFSVLVPQKSSVESSINDKKRQNDKKSTFNVHRKDYERMAKIVFIIIYH